MPSSSRQYFYKTKKKHSQPKLKRSERNRTNETTQWSEEHAKKKINRYSDVNCILLETCYAIVLTVELNLRKMHLPKTTKIPNRKTRAFVSINKCEYKRNWVSVECGAQSARVLHSKSQNVNRFLTNGKTVFASTKTQHILEHSLRSTIFNAVWRTHTSIHTAKRDRQFSHWRFHSNVFSGFAFNECFIVVFGININRFYLWFVLV